jgi:hemolysin activation/secretion protein
MTATGDFKGNRASGRGRRVRLAAGASLALVELGWSLAAVAQTPLTPFPGQPEPGRNIPAPAPEPTSPFEFSIPAPRRTPVPRAVDEIEFDVTDITVTGSTVFPPEAFKPLTDPLIGKQDKLSDIIGVADKIEAMYREKGYVLTRAYVPPQTVANGVFHVTVVEGFVKDTAVTGGDDATRERVQSYIAPVTEERPAQLGTMERGLLLANDLPGTSASGLLRPSPGVPGASDLLVNVNELPWEATVYSDNRGASSTGRITIGAQVIANDLPEIGGQFLFDASGSDDPSRRNLFQAHYATPVGLDGAVLSFSGVLGHGVPALAGGAIVSNSYSAASRLSYPIIVSRPTQVSVEGGLSVQGEEVTSNSATTCIGSIADDHWRTVDAAVTGTHRGLFQDSTTSATFDVDQGLPILGAESAYSTCPSAGGAPAGGDSTAFTKVTLVFQHDQPITGPFSANIHGLAQYGAERLVVGERTSFGGSGIGRGYDPASLSAESGVGIANELRYDFHFPQYNIDTAQLYGFFDFARVWNRHDEPPAIIVGLGNNESLASAGFGVRVSLLQSVTGDIEFAQELLSVPNNEDGHTGYRILFNAAVRF